MSAFGGPALLNHQLVAPPSRVPSCQKPGHPQYHPPATFFRRHHLPVKRQFAFQLVNDAAAVGEIPGQLLEGLLIQVCPCLQFSNATAQYLAAVAERGQPHRPRSVTPVVGTGQCCNERKTKQQPQHAFSILPP